MKLTKIEVLALAPDASSVSAAKTLAKPTNWPTFGGTDRVVWGECQGSGSKPYRTQVDISSPSPTFKCSCPSRKFPCKHGLALLLICSENLSLFANQEPEWVIEWMNGRSQRAEKKEAKAAEPFDALAAEKREQARWKKIEGGSLELRRFLCDQIGQGLASLSSEHLSGWRAMAARMVDAQAPALGDRLNELANLVGGSSHWPKQVLYGMGRLCMTIEAIERREKLEKLSQCDLRVSLGWALQTDQVIKIGERVEDVWHIVGQIEDDRENNMVERRVWLQGKSTGRHALIQEYAINGRGFEVGWVTGKAIQSTLVFYPGTMPLRAIVHGETKEDHLPPLTTMDMEENLEIAARYFGTNPWLDSIPLSFSGAVPLLTDGKWLLQFQDGSSLPMSIGMSAGLTLMACSGQEPIEIFGEWNGSYFKPLTAWNDEGSTALRAAQ